MNEGHTPRPAIVAAVALVVAVLVVMSSKDGHDGQPPTAAATNGTTRVSPRQARALPSAAPASDASVSASPVSAAMTACIAQAGQLRIRSGLTDLGDEAGGALEQRSEARALASMAASPDPITGAAADYYAARRHLFALTAGAACNAQDAACRERTDSATTALSRHAERLVGQALGTGSPLVYGWAYRVCATPGGSVAPACQLVSAGQWVRLAPGHATPWFAVAQEAQLGKDRARLDEAMFQIASAERHDGGTFVLAALLASHASPDDANPFGAALVASKGHGLGAMADIDDMQSALAYCGTTEFANANRREVCQRVATLIADRSATLPARMAGRGLAKRLGWPAERLRALQEESDAAFAVLTQEPASSASPACSATLRDLDHIRSAAELGEVEALRRRVVASGEAPVPVARLQAVR